MPASFGLSGVPTSLLLLWWNAMKSGMVWYAGIWHCETGSVSIYMTRERPPIRTTA
jgi:hypothetical protein